MIPLLLIACALATATQDSAPPASFSSIHTGFVRNDGQFADEVAFVVVNRGATAAFTRSGVELAYVLGAPASRAREEVVRTARIRLTLEGVGDPRIEAEDEQELRASFVLGNDPARWAFDVRTYGRLRYVDVVPGIDVVFFPQPWSLEYDVVVRSPERLGDLALRFEGIDEAYVDGEGGLVVRKHDGELRSSPPRAATLTHDGREPIPCRYRVDSDSRVRLELTAPAEGPLVIDPELAFVSCLTGIQGTVAIGTDDAALAVASDAAGYAYVTGVTYSEFLYGPPLIPFPNPAFQSGLGDVFVAIFDGAGNALQVAFLGGTDGTDVGGGIALDDLGDVYLTGSTQSTNFPTTSPVGPVLQGFTDAFVCKLSGSGGLFPIYSTYLGGDGSENSFTFGAIAVDSGFAYVTGDTDSSGVGPGSVVPFPTTLGAFQPAYGGGNTDGFVTKLAQDGNSLVYSSFLGAEYCENEIDCGIAIAIDHAAYVVGDTNSAGFVPSALQPGALFGQSAGTMEGFLVRVNSAGSALVYATYLRMTATADLAFPPEVIAIPPGIQSVYICGLTSNGVLAASPTAIQQAPAGGIDGYVMRVMPRGLGAADLLYHTYLGGTRDDRCGGITVLPHPDVIGSGERVIVTGVTGSLDFPVTPSAFKAILGGADDAFYTRFVSDVPVPLLSSYLGGDFGEDPQQVGLRYRAGAVCPDQVGGAYVVGTSEQSPGFGTLCGFLAPGINSAFNAFVARVICPGGFQPYGAGGCVGPFSGSQPVLSGADCPSPGCQVTVIVKDGPPLAPALLLIGGGQLTGTVMPGCLVEVLPLAGAGIVPFALDGSGTAALSATLPLATPVPLTVNFQVLALEPPVNVTFAVSNALSMSIQ